MVKFASLVFTIRAWPLDTTQVRRGTGAGAVSVLRSHQIGEISDICVSGSDVTCVGLQMIYSPPRSARCHHCDIGDNVWTNNTQLAISQQLVSKASPSHIEISLRSCYCFSSQHVVIHAFNIFKQLFYKMIYFKATNMNIRRNHIAFM